MVLFGYMFTKLDNIAHSLVGGGDNSGGLGLLLATAALGKAAWGALNKDGSGGGAGGTITPVGGGFRGALGKGLQAAGLGMGAGALMAGQGVRHVAHQIAARMRK